MGFLKKLGKSVKSLTKMVSVKNITKAVSGDFVGLTKEAVGRSLSGFKGSSESAKKSAQNAGNIVLGAVSGGANAYAKQEGADLVAPLGSTLLTATIKRFFIDHWVKLVGGIVVIGGSIWAWRKFGSSKSTKRYYR